MNNFVKQALIVSAFALMTVASAGYAGAQSKSYGDQNNYCAENPDKCGGKMNKPSDEDQGYSKKRRYQQEEDQTTVDQPDQPKMRQAQGDWKFDPNKHQRRRHKDDTFRFYFGGFWYEQPYWQGYGLGISPRISCGEGRLILRDRGFYRVRPIECQGRIYTYLGRRHGDAFRIELSARSGRIVGVDSI
jgi:hypothetical protein